jgi:hypothetical protein
MIQLETVRLIMRRWREEDFEAYAAVYADPEVMRFLNKEGPSPATKPGATWRSSSGSGSAAYHYNSSIPGLSALLASFHSIVNVSSGSVDLLCHVGQASPTNAFAVDRRLTAVKLENVSVQ